MPARLSKAALLALLSTGAAFAQTAPRSCDQLTKFKLTGTELVIVKAESTPELCRVDGIIVEVHPDPDQAVCDGPQALPAEGFADFAAAVERAAALAGKAFAPA